MKYLIAIAALVATPAAAEQPKYPENHLTAIACTENLGLTTTWEQCLNVIFQPCAAYEVGSGPHATCLQKMRDDWGVTVEGLQADVTETVTSEGSLELVRLIGEWTGYVVHKCNSVAESKPVTGREVANLGCQITEMVGLSAEMTACLQGNTKAGYCVKP